MRLAVSVLSSLLAAIAICLPNIAAADATEIEVGRMQTEMQRYYRGERQGGIWLMAIGAPAGAVGVGLLVQQNDFGRGLGYPLLAFGAIEVIAGALFYFNSDQRVPRFSRQIRSAPMAYRADEGKRMGVVAGQLHLLEAVEISLFLAGAAMTTIGALQASDMVAGVGTGLMIESSVLFVYDQLAARRAKVYGDALGRLRIGLGPIGSMGSAGRGAMLLLAGSY